LPKFLPFTGTVVNGRILTVSLAIPTP